MFQKLTKHTIVHGGGLLGGCVHLLCTDAAMGQHQVDDGGSEACSAQPSSAQLSVHTELRPMGGGSTSDNTGDMSAPW